MGGVDRGGHSFPKLLGEMKLGDFPGAVSTYVHLGLVVVEIDPAIG
jgi:hypothetical protein